jgi:hypothetical protein
VEPSLSEKVVISNPGEKLGLKEISFQDE